MQQAPVVTAFSFNNCFMTHFLFQCLLYVSLQTSFHICIFLNFCEWLYCWENPLAMHKSYLPSLVFCIAPSTIYACSSFSCICMCMTLKLRQGTHISTCHSVPCNWWSSLSIKRLQLNSFFVLFSCKPYLVIWQQMMWIWSPYWEQFFTTSVPPIPHHRHGVRKD